MCGIAGIWHRNTKPVSKKHLEVMLDTLAHRGREGTGYYVNADLGLAHNRMRVIDLSDKASQPMSGANGRYQVVFNGEIHNYTELRKELEKSGWEFRTQSDTEVVVAGFATWGSDCFNHFNGMWAIAIWDARERELILSRDRFGIKPLNYAITDGELVFASESKAIITAFPRERRPNLSRLYGYLTTGATHIRNDTFYQNIQSVAPGTFLKITPDSVESRRYWDFRPGTEDSVDNAVQRFRELLVDATRIRLRSDVPIASWLSGGLDSSVVTRITGALLGTPLQCYSLRFDNLPEDESHYAAAVADDPDLYPMEWVTPQKDDPLTVIDRIVHHHDGPTPVRGRYGMWHLAQQTSGNQVVVLNGDGADEMLGGYGFFAAPYFMDRLRNPSLHRNDRHTALQELGLLAQVQGRSKLSTARLLVAPWLFRMGARRKGSSKLFTSSFKQDYKYWDASQHQAGWAGRHNENPFKSFLNNALWHEFSSRGLPEILHGGDSISMAHTLEVRSPFLDHRVVEFCFSLPYYEKIGNGFTKNLMRRAFADILPEDVNNRRRKFGFMSPINRWLREPENLDPCRKLLVDGQCVEKGILDPVKLKQYIDNPASRRTDLSGDGLWRWISTELWLRRDAAL